MLGTGYFLKIVKINFQPKKTNQTQSQKLVPGKHKKIANRQK